MNTRLSVNVNKIALIRNARGSNFPNLEKLCRDIESFGAEGITVHPRPDERHIRYADIPVLKAQVQTEFNIEGNPKHQPFLDLVLAHPPHQCTLVPDTATALTSDSGWDTHTHAGFLKDTIAQLQAKGIRVSIFCSTDPHMIEGAKAVGADRIELYTGPYAQQYDQDRAAAVQPYRAAAETAHALGLELNAGHDLNLHNLRYFKAQVPHLMEVSIGHALVVDALYHGLESTIAQYKACLAVPERV